MKKYKLLNNIKPKIFKLKGIGEYLEIEFENDELRIYRFNNKKLTDKNFFIKANKLKDCNFNIVKDTLSENCYHLNLFLIEHNEWNIEYKKVRRSISARYSIPLIYLSREKAEKDANRFIKYVRKLINVQMSNMQKK
jgi:hypothetical protein